VNRIRLVRGVTLFFVSNIALFFVSGRLGIVSAVAFFLWVGIFNELGPLSPTAIRTILTAPLGRPDVRRSSVAVFILR
jgi:hypothetical protein